MCGVSWEDCAVSVFCLNLVSILLLLCLNAIFSARAGASSEGGVVLVGSGSGGCVGV